MLLERLVEIIADHTAKLDELAERRIDLTSWQNLYLVLHVLQVHAQATIDLLMHACSLIGTATPTPMACIDVLKARGYVDEEEAALLKRMVRFRNIVVHEYGNIDVERVKTILYDRGYRRILHIAYKVYKRLMHEGIDP